MKFLAKIYEGLGNSKSQRFWRAFLILCLISAVLIIGFYTDAINFVFSIGAKGE
jgi:di/tricarboxylate transporter